MAQSKPSDSDKPKHWLGALLGNTGGRSARSTDETLVPSETRLGTAHADESLAHAQPPTLLPVKAKKPEAIDGAQPPTPSGEQQTAKNSAASRLVEGDRIGPWRVVDVVGAGGMSVVYRAQRSDGQFQQQVAIKVLTLLPGEGAQAMIAHERRLLASVAHPNIARILDTGTTATGAPYIAMDLVEGEQIDGHCARHVPDWRAVLQLFLPLCSAMQDAHKSLVLHCDLKPANLLVTKAGVPMVLDFGIAQAISARRAATAKGNHALTPRYASPEQAAGLALTTASDVYALGKVMGRCLRHTNCSRITKTELEALVKRCTEEDPRERYVTMSELAADIRRMLADEPLRAMRPSWLYRARKLTQRRRPAVLAGAVAVCGIGAFMVDANVQRNRAVAAEVVAQASEQIARTELARATLAERDARLERDRAQLASAQAASSAKVALAEQARATAALRAADNERDRAVRAGIAAQLAAVTAKTAQAQSDKDAEAARVAQRQAQLDRANSQAVRDFLTGLFQNVNKQTAGPRQVSAYELLESGRKELMQQKLTDPRTRSELLQALADIYERVGDVENTRKLYEEIAQLERDANTGRPLVLAQALSRVGLAHANGFNPRAGEPFSREALAIRKAQLGEEHLDVADSHTSMAVVLGQLRRHPEALEHAEAALRIRQKQLQPGDSRLASSLQAMGSAQLLAGDNLQALRYYDQSIALHTQTSGADHFYTLNALEGKGIALRGLNRLDDAQAVLRQLYDTQVRVNGADAERVASTAMRLAEVYLTQGRLEPGHRFADISTRILSKAASAERTIRFASSATVLAHFLELRGDYAASAEQHRQALAVRERVLKPDDVALAGPLTMVARVLQKAGHADEAAELCHRALALRRANLKADHPDLTDTHIWLADAYAWGGKPLLARAALSQASKPEATQPLRRISYLRVESMVLSAEGRHAEAAAAAKERSDLGTQQWGEKHPLVVIPKVEMASAHLRSGNFAAAQAAALGVGEHMPPNSDQFLPNGAIATAWKQALQAR